MFWPKQRELTPDGAPGSGFTLYLYLSALHTYSRCIDAEITTVVLFVSWLCNKLVPFAYKENTS